MAYREILLNKAAEFIGFLENNKISASVDEESRQTYSVKINIEDFGYFTLFYSPKKLNFKITTKKAGNDFVGEKISMLWDELNSKSGVNTVYKNEGYEVDVDGSYIKGITSWAAIIRKDGKPLKELSGLVRTDNIKNSHQIAGEIKAVLETIIYCQSNNINEIIIYYDYAGLRYWATGAWKAKIFVSQFYQDFMKNVKIKIKWVKIPSHNGYYWNEKTDELAKKAAGNK